LKAFPFDVLAGGLIKVLEIGTKFRQDAVVLLKERQRDETHRAHDGASNAPDPATPFGLCPNLFHFLSSPKDQLVYAPIFWSEYQIEGKKERGKRAKPCPIFAARTIPC